MRGSVFEHVEVQGGDKFQKQNSKMLKATLNGDEIITKTGAMVAFSSGAVTEIKWKSSAGFITLDAMDFTAIATAVAGHIQACFTNEAALSALIDAAESKPNLQMGWPS